MEIEGSVVTPERFQQAVDAFLAILADVSKAVSAESGERVDWRVQVKKGSILLGVSPAPGISRAVAARVSALMLDGLKRLEREAIDPPFFGEKALVSARRLATTVGEKIDDDTRIRIWGTKTVVPVTRQTAEHVATVLEEAHGARGTVEGQLRTVSNARGFRVVIYEPVFGKAVQCDIPEILMRSALDLFGKRVEAHGVIRYRRNGSVARIIVDELLPFPPEDTLPSHEEVRGILREYM